METPNLNKNIVQLFESQYIIPLYQRNFAWREKEIRQLLQDIYAAYKKDNEGNYFIGSLVVLKRQNDFYEVIDGQQRLTALTLIAKELELQIDQKLSYDSRPYVKEFLDDYYAGKEISNHNHPTILHIKEAIELIRNIHLCEETEGGKRLTLSTLEKNDLEDFSEYFSNHVIIVRVEIPSDTDVASYFEIMNNRGEQLQEHEILKALLLKNIDTSQHAEFSSIWNACSQIDIPIQKLFDKDRRTKYFSDNYNSFNFEKLTEQTSEKSPDPLTIDKIIEEGTQNDPQNSTANEVCNDTDQYKYTSIIDFPNFIMHIC